MKSPVAHFPVDQSVDSVVEGSDYGNDGSFPGISGSQSGIVGSRLWRKLLLNIVNFFIDLNRH